MRISGLIPSSADRRLALFFSAPANPAGAGQTSSSPHFFSLLLRLGGVGIFALAVIDSSVIPIPLPGSTDLVLLLLTAFRSSSVTSPIEYASCAFAGSVIGGYMTWAAGKKGGEAALAKLGKGRFIHRVQNQVKKHGMVSVFLAALIPPPVPLMPFLLAAGALGLSRPRFLISYCSGRAVRYGVIAWLAFHYGRYMLAMWQKYLNAWTTPIITVYVALILVGVGFSVWKFRKEKRKKN